ncbi:hypothetical protein BDV37DRAFT_255368 [Aspergillus pseudonomiae]|uniref:Uncharacterized protein n=1 Tax=Aspergillus pseudonomiae TaxID=1506151 RepID=A0A5N7D4M5_9EURO|nr:uncharacterized protein BDV37DRAFT_255368 [Aspergillus pseudonomiae]KAE8401362.1 hypothetical protein BDV37DRAFT_255368 [Aspergillus pseudonomiae]
MSVMTKTMLSQLQLVEALPSLSIRDDSIAYVSYASVFVPSLGSFCCCEDDTYPLKKSYNKALIHFNRTVGRDDNIKKLLRVHHNMVAFPDVSRQGLRM